MCDPILVTLLKMQPHYCKSSRENATPSSGTSPVASYKEVPPPPPRDPDLHKDPAPPRCCLYKWSFLYSKSHIQTKKSSMGRMWIFSETTHCCLLISLSPPQRLHMENNWIILRVSGCSGNDGKRERHSLHASFLLSPQIPNYQHKVKAAWKRSL